MASNGSDIKECWYSVLGVERTATADEIKLKYRKEALKWHPDKIQQSGATAQECQEATARFQNIVQAYEVLSDPVERSWYDKYRSEILSSGTASKDFEFNVFSFFSPSAFSGFGNTGKGFYKVYKDVFANIHKKEQAFAKAYGMGPIGEAPSIGIPTSPISDVEEFYKYWTGFSTVKDFSWCDEYQVSQAPNRKVRRLMEEENAKIRKRERRAYNDAVRDLATFVKKRDKRWIERQLEVQRLQKEKELQMKLRKQKLQEEKIAKARAVKEQDWMKVESTALDDNDGFEDANEGSYGWKSGVKKKSEDDDLVEYFCIVCNKRFRSEKQWKNHEKSKKHVERASALKQSLLDEDEEVDTLAKDLNLKTDELESPPSGAPEGAIGEAGGESVSNGGSERFRNVSKQPAGRERNFPKERQRNKQTSRSRSEEDEEGDEGVEEDDENSLLEAMMNSRISRMAVPATKAQSSQDANTGNVADEQDREPTADDLSSDSDEDTADVVNRGDDDEDSLPDSMLGANRSQSRFSSVEPNSAETSRTKVNFASGAGSPHVGEEDEDDKGEEREEREEEQENDRDEEEEEVGSSSDLGKHSGRRRSKAEKKREAARGRYESLSKELSPGRSEKARGLEHGVDSDDEVQELSIGVSQKPEPVIKPTKKKLQRGQKKSKLEAALSQQSEHAGKKSSMKGKGGSKSVSNTCDTCGEDFDSRSQLFRHISSTNHATLKSR